MDRLRLIVQNPLSLLGVGVLFIVLLIVSLVSFITKPAQGPAIPSLTTQERQYTEAPRQPFPTAENQQYGTLIVTSTVEQTRVLIDVSEDEVESVVPQQNVIPATSITPFRIAQIPVGEHILTASKPGYYLTTIPFEIKTNEVTRIAISLDSLTETVDDTTEENFHYGAWIKQLPITDPYYYIEYNKDTDTIRATLYPPPSFSQTTQEQVDQLKAEVQQKLQAIGVDLSKETIDWLVKQ